MSQPNPSAPPQIGLAPRTDEAAAYRPVSVPAVAGLVIALLYVGLVVISLLVKVIQGTPLFLPGWTLLLPITSAALSLIAWWLISNSEGTRAGLTLALWGFGLSSVAGLGYFAVEYFTGLALIQQANRFLLVMEPGSGFFPRLQTGEPAEINAAFLLTLPEASRGNVDPRDSRKMEILHDRGTGKGSGPLTSFREHALVRAVTRGKNRVTIEPRGVQGWFHEKFGYLVVRNYHVDTPEAAMDLVIPVASTEGDERKWFVSFPKLEIKKMETTRLGSALLNLGYRAVDFVKFKTGGALAPGFRDITNWAKVAPEKTSDHVKKHVATWFLKGGEDNHRLIPAKDSASWEVRNGHLRISLRFTYILNLEGPNERWAGEGVLVVEQQRPVVLDADQLPDPSSVANDPRELRPVSVEFTRFGNITKG